MITFIRGFTLLAILIALPGLAIFWNHLPKDLWSKSAPKIEKQQFFPKDSGESATSVSLFAPGSVPSVSPEIPVATAARAVSTPLHEQPILPNNPIRQVSWEHPRTELPQDFESLKLRLHALGTKSYSLQKWGNRGELFRFSCFVAPSEPHTYEKHFQFIGPDAVTVMQTVITEIEQWKNVQ